MGQNSVVGTIANDSTVLRQGFEQPQYLGCMDPLACNYDPAASIENGTCRYDVAVNNTHYICQGESLVIGNSTYTVSGIYTDVNHIQTMSTGDVALLKGSNWQNNELSGLVHRSPKQINSEKRLVITLDFID